jgi:hypothetical protein
MTASKWANRVFWFLALAIVLGLFVPATVTYAGGDSADKLPAVRPGCSQTPVVIEP